MIQLHPALWPDFKEKQAADRLLRIGDHTVFVMELHLVIAFLLFGRQETGNNRGSIKFLFSVGGGDDIPALGDRVYEDIRRQTF